MQIFIHREEQDFGPYTVEEAQQRLDSGELFPEDYAWYEGAADWMALEEIPGVVPPAAKPEPKRVNTGLPAWIPPRRSEEAAETGASPTSFASPAARTGGTRPVFPIARPASSPPAVTAKPSAPMAAVKAVSPPAVSASAAQPSMAPIPTRNQRSMGMRNMIIGGLVCVVGSAITFFSYESATSDSHGGSYTVAWGAVLFGGIQFLRGLMQFVKG